MSNGEVGKQIMYEVPWKEWAGESPTGATNAHDKYRRTLLGKVIITGASQPFRYNPTHEIKSQFYKYADVTGTPFDMFLNIIPGMHPFHWDLSSAIVSASAPLLGIADGIIDDAPVKFSVDKLYKKIVKQSPKRFVKIEEGRKEDGGKPSGGLGYGNFGLGFPKSYFEQTVDAVGKGYEISTDGILKYFERVNAVGKHQEFEKIVDVEGKIITFRAINPEGNVKYHSKSKFIV